MMRWLIVTPLDVQTQPNNREHHLLAHIAPRMRETVVVFRRRNDRAGALRLLLDTVVPRAHRSRAPGGTLMVSTNPPINTPQGMAMDIAGTYQMTPLGERAADGRQVLLRLISEAAILKDLLAMAWLFVCAQWMTRGRFEVCTALGPYGSAVARLLRATGKVGAYVYQDRDYEPGFVQTPMRNALARYLENSGIRQADAVATVGYRLSERRRQETGRMPVVITSGVDAARFQAPARDLSAPVLVYTGNVTFWSGLEFVVDALHAIRAVRPARLLVVGEALPGYRALLEERIRALGLTAAVDFTGRVDNRSVPAYLASAHIGVAVFRPLALKQYASPLKVLEYMAAGLPCVGSLDMEVEDLLVRHGCGRAVPLQAEAIATAVLTMLDDPAAYREMSRRGREAALTQYGWPTLMQREYELLQACGRQEA